MFSISHVTLGHVILMVQIIREYFNDAERDNYEIGRRGRISKDKSNGL